MEEKLKKLIDDFFPSKQAEVFKKRLDGSLSNKSSTEYTNFKNAKKKLLLAYQLLQFPEVMDVFNDKRFNGIKKVYEDNTNYKLSQIELPRIGLATREKLQAYIKTVNELLEYTPTQLQEILGVSLTVSNLILRDVNELKRTNSFKLVDSELYRSFDKKRELIYDKVIKY